MGRMKIPIPDNLSPPRDKCVILHIPSDVQWQSAFWGNLYNLTSATIFANNDAHDAIAVAALWWQIYQQARIERCAGDISEPVSCVGFEGDNMGLIRQNGCKLETSNDGVNWCTLADFSPCVSGQGQQPVAPTLPGPGESYSDCRTLQGSQQMLLPVPVSAGDIITFSSLSGAWSDGPGLSFWWTYDGTPYVLGLVGGVRIHQGTDPSATQYHGQLIMNIGGTWYSCTDGPVTVPVGVNNVTAYIQMNDSPINDNQGAISFCVNVQKAALPANTWQHIFNFTTGQHGWSTGSANTTYVAGTGFVAGDVAIAGGFERSAYINLQTNMQPGTYTYFEMDFAATFGNFAYGGAAASPTFLDMPNGTTRVSQNPAAGQNHILTTLPNVANPASASGKVFADKQTTAPALVGQVSVTKVILRGTGTTDPYAAF